MKGPYNLAGLAISMLFSVANEAALAATFQGTADYSLALNTRGKHVQKSELMLTPRFDFDLSETARATLIARGRFDAVDELSPGQPVQLSRSHWNRRAYLGNKADVELREFYVDSTLGDVELRLGKQQEVWGQADGLRVLDVLNPMDYREFILPDADDRRIPLWMLNAESPLGDGTLQLIAIVDQTYDQLPPFDASFGFSSRLLVPSAPANVPVFIDNHDRPRRALEDGDAGVRWQAFIGGWDFSLNYLYHYADQAVFFLEQDQSGVVVSPTYKRTHLLGGTFSNAFGDFALRGELGYSTDRYWVADPTRVGDGVVESPELAYVLGLDYSGINDTFLSFQVFQSYLTEHPSEAIRDRSETQVTALLRRNFWNEALALEAFMIQSVNDSDGLLQLEAGYQFRSDLVGKVGTDLFYGDETGLFGQFHRANRIHVGLTYSF